MKSITSNKSAFTLVEIMIVVAIIGLLAAMALPNLIRARTRAQTTTCISNLRQIDGAKQQWGLENKQPDTATPAQDDVKAYIRHNLFPGCPASGTYTVGAVSTDPTCTTAAHVLPPP